MPRTPSSAPRVRRPLGLRDAIRAVVSAAGLAAGMGVMRVIGPHRDVLTTELTLAYGLVLGLVIAFALASRIRGGPLVAEAVVEPLCENRNARLRQQPFGADPTTGADHPPLP